ncbi:MAG: TIGR04552 family protein [Alphaproteobacteria bacterium]|nr:TIGR04552 family protein [Alphaproteobacteria bacterium]
MLFPFETLRAMVGGASAIDVPRLRLLDLDEADAFLECYGFRVDDPADREDLEEIRQAALAILRDVLLDPHERIAPAIVEERDVRRLLLRVSTDDQGDERMWACALLRVMHTVAHARSDLSERYADAIEEQILGRFRAVIEEDEDGLWLGDIPLVHFEARSRKPLASIVLKLLHKPENVAADIFDRLGVRFVTRSRLDALLVVRFLRKRNVVMFANVKPSRSKNTLIDLDALERALQSEPDLDALDAEIQTWPYPHRVSGLDNPHSSREYHAIQFTGRQRIRLEDVGGRPIRFFFPFEVQVLDEEAYRASRVGYASHEEYKERQRQAARHRVLGPLARTGR